MDPLTTSLKLSAVGLRMAGYMLENNLRMAQALGQAAIASNPLMYRVEVIKSTPAKPKRPAASAPRTKTASKTASKTAAKTAAKTKLAKPVAAEAPAIPAAKKNAPKTAKKAPPARKPAPSNAPVATAKPMRETPTPVSADKSAAVKKVPASVKESETAKPQRAEPVAALAPKPSVSPVRADAQPQLTKVKRQPSRPPAMSVEKSPESAGTG